MQIRKLLIAATIYLGGFAPSFVMKTSAFPTDQGFQEAGAYICQMTIQHGDWELWFASATRIFLNQGAITETELDDRKDDYIVKLLSAFENNCPEIYKESKQDTLQSEQREVEPEIKIPDEALAKMVQFVCDSREAGYHSSYIFDRLDWEIETYYQGRYRRTYYSNEMLDIIDQFQELNHKEIRLRYIEAIYTIAVTEYCPN